MPAKRQRGGSAVLFGLPGQDGDFIDGRSSEEARKVQLHLNPEAQVFDELSPRPPKDKPRGHGLSPGVLRRTTSSDYPTLLSILPTATVVVELSEEETAEEAEQEDEENGGDEQLLTFLAQSTTQQRRRALGRRREIVDEPRRTLPLLTQDTKAAGLQLAIKRGAAVGQGADVDALEAAITSAAAEAAPELTETRSVEFSNGATYTGPGAVRLGIWYPHGRGELVLPVFTGLGLDSGAYARGVVYCGMFDWGQRARHGTLRYPATDPRTRAQFKLLWKELEGATLPALRKRVMHMGVSINVLRAATDGAEDPRREMMKVALNYVSDVYKGTLEPAGSNTDVKTNAHQSQIFEVVDSRRPSPPPPPKLQRHGRGEMWWGGVDEATWHAHYVGAFNQDRRHGSGVMRWRANDLAIGNDTGGHSGLVPTEYRYEGEWRDGKPCGTGKMTKRRQLQVSAGQEEAADERASSQHQEPNVWEESVAVGEWREGVPLTGIIEEQLFLPRLAERQGQEEAALSPSSYQGAWGNVKKWRGALARFQSAGRKAMKLSELTPLQHAKRVAGKRAWRLFTQEEKSMALARSIEIFELAEDQGDDEVRWDERELQAGSIAEADSWWPRRNGKGLCNLPEGGTFKGDWAADLPHGEGELTLPDGIVVRGNLWNAARPGVVQGKATVSYPDGGLYKGQWDGRYGRHGNGRMQFPVPQTNAIKGGALAAHVAVYQGNWVKDEIDGHGKLTYFDGAEYMGELSDGRPCGEGTMTYPPGTRNHALSQVAQHCASASGSSDAGPRSSLPAAGVEPALEPERRIEETSGPIIVRFEGKWLNGWRVHGTCEYSPTIPAQETAAQGGGQYRADAVSSGIDIDWAGWLRYTGYIQDSKEHGYGVVQYVDGRSFEGHFVNGRRSDYYICPHGSNGSHSKAKSQVKVEGRMTYPAGHVYVGEFCHGLRNGFGTMWYPNADGVLLTAQAGLQSYTKPTISSQYVSSVLYQAALVLEEIAEILNAREQSGNHLKYNQFGSGTSDLQIERRQTEISVGTQKRSTSFMQHSQAPPASPTSADDQQPDNHNINDGGGDSAASAVDAATVLGVDTDTDCCFEGDWLDDQRMRGQLASSFPETDYDIAPPSVAAVALAENQRTRKLHKGGQRMSGDEARRYRAFAWERNGPCRYVGGWWDERPHGTGVMRWWSSGKRTNGTAAAGGETYSGQWHRGARHGVGISVRAQSLVYNGEWAKDRWDGAGDLIEMYACSRYKGTFRKGQRHGTGLEREDGTGGQYRGSWQVGAKHGAGVYRYRDGTEWARRYSNGELVTDKLIGAPDHIDGAVGMEEGWRLQVQDGDELNSTQFQTPCADNTAALEYDDRMAKLRARHRAVLVSVETRVSKELKTQRSRFNQRQRTKVLMVEAMRQEMLMARQHAVASEVTTQKELDTIRRNQLQTMPSATLEELKDEG